MVLFKTSSRRDLEPKKDSEDLKNILSGHKYQTFFTLFYFFDKILSGLIFILIG